MTNPHTNVGRKKALLIAIRHVKGFSQSFPHAHREALLLRDLLISNFDYLEENVVLMIDDSRLPSHLWPSRKNILEQITKMVAGASSNDCFFFFYSGQASDTKTNGVKEEVIFAHTGMHISGKTLKKLLVTPLPRGSKLFALWDSGRPVTYLDLEHRNCNRLSRRRMPLREPSIPDPPSGSIPIADRQTPPRGRAEDPPSTLNGVKLIRPHSPTSWLPHMFPDPSPSAYPRSLSPISFYPQSNCMGNCRKTNPEDQQDAQVVSLDSTNIYTSTATGDSFTKFFIECMSQDPKLSLSALLEHIENRVDQLQAERLLAEGPLTFRNNIRPKKPRRDAVDNLDAYMNSQNETKRQNVYLTSRYPLDKDQLMDTIF